MGKITVFRWNPREGDITSETFVLTTLNGGAPFRSGPAAGSDRWEAAIHAVNSGMLAGDEGNPQGLFESGE